MRYQSVRSLDALLGASTPPEGGSQSTLRRDSFLILGSLFIGWLLHMFYAYRRFPSLRNAAGATSVGVGSPTAAAAQEAPPPPAPTASQTTAESFSRWQP